MARKTKDEAEATKEAILEAATAVFHEKGVAKTSLEEIANTAGVTRGAIYWHFKNKTDIFFALHDQLYENFSGTIARALEPDCPHPLEQLKNLCIELLQELETNKQKQKVLTLFFLRCDYTGEMETLIEYQQKQRMKSMKMFADHLERAKQKGSLPASCETEKMALSLFCYLTGIAFEYLRYPKRFSMKSCAPALMEQYFKGLCCA